MHAIDTNVRRRASISGKPSVSYVGQYQQLIRNRPTLSREESMNLARAGTKDARRKLVEGNLRLVVLVAKKFASPWDEKIMDFIQLGNIGLMRAAKKFDPNKNNSFQTYAKWHIGAAIIANFRGYFRTVHRPRIVDEYDRARSKALQKLSLTTSQPTEDEIIDEIVRTIEMSKKIAEQKTKAIISRTNEHMLLDQGGPRNREGLDTPVNHAKPDGLTLQDVLADPTLPTINQEAKEGLEETFIALFMEFVGRQQPEKAQRLQLRFGFAPVPTFQIMPVREVGERFGVSGNAIHLLEKGTVEKFLKLPEVKKLLAVGQRELALLGCEDDLSQLFV